MSLGVGEYQRHVHRNRRIKLYIFKENENMKKTKFSNLLVAATLVVGTLFSSAMPAFAASSDIIDDTRKASVTVHKFH